MGALLTKYAEHRGTGDEAKWTVITREFNLRLPEEAQKTENSVKRAAKKFQEAAQALDKVLAKFSETPASSPDAEHELLSTLAKKYENHRGTGDDAKWTVLLREFNARVVEASQKSEAALKRAMKKLSQEPEKVTAAGGADAQNTAAAAAPKAAKENVEPIAEPKEDVSAEAGKDEAKAEGSKKSKNKK